MATNRDAKRSGFSLFPTPPTPPINRAARNRLRRKAISHVVSSRGSLPPVSELLPYTDCRIPTSDVGLQESPHADLVSGALQIPETGRSVDSESLNHKEASQDPTSIGKRSTWRGKVSGALDRTSRPKTLPSTTGGKKVEPSHARLESRMQQANIGRVRKPSAGRLSHLIDAQEGGVDHKTLSLYLGNALNVAFEMPELTGSPDPPPEPVVLCCMNPEKQMKQGLQSLHTPLAPSKSRSGDNCKCRLGAIICQCSSSPDFQRFRKTRMDHRQQTSISSTRCLMGIPRARFKTVFLDIEIPESLYIPNMWSPPALSYSSEDSKERESLDWSIPESPTLEEDPFVVPTESSSREMQQLSKTEGPEKTVRASGKSFFRRPFLRMSHAGARASPTKNLESAGHGLGMQNHLGSMDTLSTFHVDLDPHMKIKDEERYSLPESTLDDVQTPPLLTPMLSPTPSRLRLATMYEEPGQARMSHISLNSYHSLGHSSTCSSSFEVIEPVNTAILAQAAPAKAVMVVNKRNSVMSRRASQSRVEFRRRVERERERQHEAYAYQYQHQCQPQRKLTVRNPDRTSTASVSSSIPRHDDNDMTPSTAVPTQCHDNVRVEIGTDCEATNHRRTVTSNGSPVLGKVKLVLVSE